MSGIFDENNMMQALKKYLPDGEAVVAGIHACANESHIRRVFCRCILDDLTLIPAEKDSAIEVKKTKYSAYDIYLGITSHSLVIAECEKYKHLYEFNYDIDPNGVAVEEVSFETSLYDIGTCYPFEAIQTCEMKKGWLGSVKCMITMKNGDYFKLMLPKRSGFGGGMPHHQQYREEIISRLRALHT